MYQKIILVGNLGSDPEMRYMPNGNAVTNFSLATNESYTDRETGERVENATWWRVSVWGKSAEACNQYLARGARVLVEGKMKPDPATGAPKLFTRQDGTVGASYEMTAFSVQFLTRASDMPGAGEGASGAGTTPDYEEDDVPF